MLDDGDDGGDYGGVDGDDVVVMMVVVVIVMVVIMVLPLVSDPGSNVDPCRQSQTVLHELGEKMKMHGEIQLETEFSV